jgi:tRNA threonylcarbamoyladenosine biosynthesis protein TsaE
MSYPLKLSIPVSTEAETQEIAKRLSAYLKVGDIVRLDGTLGAGKTAFARALVRSLVGRDIEVPSPTFNLLLMYEASVGPVYHYDFYRLEDPEEVWELDIEDAFESGITLMEWTERLEDLAPKAALQIELNIPTGADTSRILHIRGNDLWAARLASLHNGEGANG